MKWYDGFALAMAVPALLLYSLGDMAARLGVGSIIVWIISMFCAVWIVFGYAELAGMFPNKAGGFGVFQYMALRNADFAKKHPVVADTIGCIGVWGYWWAWSPVLAIGGLVVGNWFQLIFPQIPLYVGGFIPTDVIIGAAFLFMLYMINYFGIVAGAFVSWILTFCTIIPLGILSIGPFFMGLVDWSNFVPFLPMDWRFYGGGVLLDSWWQPMALYGILGGLFIASWCDWAYEAAAVYTAEYQNPQKDTYKAILMSTIFCGFFYILLPITTYGVLGYDGIIAAPLLAIPEIGIMMFGQTGGYLMMFMMMAAILLALNQATNGGGRSLYQMAEDGLLLKQFAAVNKHKVPSVAMLYDVLFNVVLMFLRSPIVILAASTVGYNVVQILGNRAFFFLRKKFPNTPRPFKVPKWMLVFLWPMFIVCILQLSAAPVFGGNIGTLVGVVVAICVILVYTYRRKVQDRPGYKIFGESLLPDYLKGTPDKNGKLNALTDKIGFISLLLFIYALVLLFAYIGTLGFG